MIRIRKKSPKIVALIYGGIGNQLFCYAAARRMAIKQSAELILDTVSGFEHDKYDRQYQLDHFHVVGRKSTPWERFEPFGRIRRKLARILNKKLSFYKRWYIRQEKQKYDPRLLKYSPQRYVYLHGNWQSEKYFKDVENYIRQELIIRPPDDMNNLSYAKRIKNNNSVAIHVRFFDNPKINTGVNNASTDYYEQAIALSEQKIPNAHYFLFSDSPENARSKIPIEDERITMITHNSGELNAFADLWLMTRCKHFIIANSTFSWWGAWLSKNKNKIVIAPFFQIEGPGKCTSWGFPGLLPPEWIKIKM